MPKTTTNERSPRRVLTWIVALTGALLASVFVPASHSSAAQSTTEGITIYDDQLGPGFANWSWAKTDLAATDPVVTGNAIEVHLGSWSGLSIGSSAPLATTPNQTLEFDVHTGHSQNVTLRVVAMDAAFATAGEAVIITAPADQWSTFSIPLADLGVESVLGGVWWQEATGSDQGSIYVDNIMIAAPDVEPEETPTPTSPPQPDAPTRPWTFEETFDGDPSSPSQDLLPRSFEYAATHRSHPKEHFSDTFGPYPADHADSCAGPNPDVVPLPQHLVMTSHESTSSSPDESFFVCKNHMMSSMGNVAGYSVTSFWPRQEFNFAGGGVLEFEVNLNDAHGNRSWWEVMIVPRDELKIASGPVDSPISETYPHDRIVLDFRRNVRTVKVGQDALAPAGWLVNETQWGQWDYAWWRDLHPEEPGLDDRRIRRTMRVQLNGDHVVWGIETPDGTFDEWRVDVPGGLPFDQGLVLFKTHAYNAPKDGNLDTYTFHWDNIRFDGPVLAPYVSHEASDVIYLQRNGDRPIGDEQTVTIDLPATLNNPVLFGQVHQPKAGQVLLSINGGPDIAVAPYDYERDDCISDDWQSFRLPLDPAALTTGENTLTWTVGPRPDNCSYGPFNWDGFSVKSLQIQTDS